MKSLWHNLLRMRGFQSKRVELTAKPISVLAGCCQGLRWLCSSSSSRQNNNSSDNGGTVFFSRVTVSLAGHYRHYIVDLLTVGRPRSISQSSGTQKHFATGGTTLGTSAGCQLLSALCNSFLPTLHGVSRIVSFSWYNSLLTCTTYICSMYLLDRPLIPEVIFYFCWR